MTWGIALIALGIGALVFLLGWRSYDRWIESSAWSALEDVAGLARGTYEPALVAGLPQPAQRYFSFMIRPGTPLCSAVELEMSGELGLGSRDAPGYRPMTAKQLLAPPYGLVWKLRSGLIAGSDGATPSGSWTRFWVGGLIPIVRVRGDADHFRSAFGRVVAEAAFWAPASLLPGETVSWEDVDANTARAVVSFGALRQAVDVTVNPDGQPTQVLIQRWSNENPERIFRAQPFGGSLSEFKEFCGYRLPTRVEGGNHFGTDAYFPFYKVNVISIRCSGGGASS